MMSRNKKGMLAAFIDFRTAYDRLDQSKLWDCLEGAGLKGSGQGDRSPIYGNQ